ncbi:solute carrier organic anion transporter family member 3A1 [Strongylocentrotus purpuratus]|uniref:Solute carrier organic anion transporter family member n=1 Tax=Strongylocentrotus purpuratus TaxID=7668 RepID=A0A7M7GHQ2_STRPU|nr:solute carrier organic anion transporter family member 3A1 [Strongylocentrotus purpuratus]
MKKDSTRRCINHISFTVLLGATLFVYIGSIGPYTSGILTTIQREFQFKSSEVGLVLSINDIVALVLVTPIAYIGASRHRPRILGFLTIFFAIGCFMCALPQFTGNKETTTKTTPTSVTPFNESAKTEDVTSLPYAGLQNTSLCEIDTDDDCSKEEVDASGAQYGRATWFLVGQGFLGLGATGYWTLGLTYMDDGLPSRTAPYMHMASLFVMFSLSPLAAFALSGIALSLHTDFYKIDVDELGYDSKDPRWVGAWWLGYVIYGLLTLFLAIPYFFFPKDWPEKAVVVVDLEEKKMKEKRANEEDDDQPSTAFLIKSNLPGPDSTCLGMVKGYFSATRRLATNMTYSTLIISSISDSIMFAGFFSFLGRYLQTQYDVTPSMTSIILGCASTPSGVVGNMLGGICFKRLKLSLKGLCGAIITGGCFTLFILGMFFVVSCDTSPIAGLNTPYPDGTEMIGRDVPIASCMSGCTCPVGVYTPVCGSNGITYVTPCHAGCKDQSFDDDSDQMIYSNCSCIGSNAFLTTPAYEDDTSVPEKCSTSCTTKKYGFIALLALLFLFYAFLNVPCFILFIRTVDNKDKAVALAFSSLLQRVLAFIPAPIFFGAAIQTTCMMFQESCGITGNCLVYDNIRLSRVIIGLVLIFKVMALIMYTICYFTIRRNESGEYTYLQLCQQETPDDTKSAEAAMCTIPYETTV